MITLKPEARDPGILNVFCEELCQSFGVHWQCWIGKQELRTKAFLTMMYDLEKFFDGTAVNDAMKERIFTHLRNISKDPFFPRQDVIAEYTEFFFTNVVPKIPAYYEEEPYCRITSRELIEQLCTLIVQEETDIKTRVAAYRLLSQLVNPYTKMQFDSYKEQNPAVKEGLEKFGRQLTELSVEFPEPPQQSFSLAEFGKIVFDGNLSKGALLLITLKETPPCVVEFISLDSPLSPHYLHGLLKENNKIQLFREDQIQTIEIVASEQEAVKATGK